MNLPESVRLVEVGARDGLQNEPQIITTAQKIALIDGLVDTGIQHLEVGSFVSPKWVPEMADSTAVFNGIKRRPGICYAALTPNVIGLEAAIAAGADEVAIFGAVSERFSQKNINCSISASLKRFESVMEKAAAYQLPVRAYISCVWGCPYEGQVAPQKVLDISKTLIDMGCYEISLGDTIGIATPLRVQALIGRLLDQLLISQLAVHFHDSRGQALANILAALQMGVAVVDSAIAGLGGCPYAGHRNHIINGNVASEDVLYMLNGMGIKTGIDLNKLITLSNRFCTRNKLQQRSRVSLATWK